MKKQREPSVFFLPAVFARFNRCFADIVRRRLGTMARSDCSEKAPVISPC